MSQHKVLSVLRGPALAVLCGAVLLLCAWRIVDNFRAFHVVQSSYAPRDESGKNWFRPEGGGAEFRAVNLPFWLEDGRFRVTFETSERQVEVRLFAADCLKRVYLDGALVKKDFGVCRPCKIWNRQSSDRCKAHGVLLDVGAPGRHLLAVETRNIPERDYDQNRDQRVFFVHHDNDAFGWRLLALLSLVFAAWSSWSFYRTRDWLRLPAAGVAALWRHRALTAVLVLLVVLRFVVNSGFMSTDVSESALLYTENLVNKSDFHFAALDPDYEAAKYFGGSHMHKPPGVYYQYAALRLLFGFNEAYFPGMARVPGMLGDVILAWLLWVVVRERRGEWDGLAAAATYALSTGVFVTNGFVGRIDSLAVALLALALRQLMKHPQGSRLFALFMGAAVAWKQLALLITPLLLTSRSRFKWLLVAGGVTTALCAPYLFDDPVLFFQRLTMPQLEKAAGGVSWMINLKALGLADSALPKIITLGYMLTLCLVPFVYRLKPLTAAALTYGLFVLAGSNVHEQYMSWAMPFMLAVAFLERSASAYVAFLLGTLTMALKTEAGQVIPPDVLGRWAAVLAAAFAVACAGMLLREPWQLPAPLQRLVGRKSAAVDARPTASASSDDSV